MTEAPSENDEARQPAREGLPERTTPTWEVELLISGAAVFAMLQLPGWLDERFFELAPRLDQQWSTMLLLGYVYAKCGALILAGTFVLYLLLRAHWIALVGIDSVFHGGVRWDRVRLGPLQKGVERERLGTIANAIERSDNRSTVVFAVGVYLAMQLLKLLGLVAIAALAALALSPLVTFDAAPFVSVVIGVVVLPMSVASSLDLRIGQRIDPHGAAGRTLRAMFGVFHAIGFGRASTPAMLLLTSHAGPRRIYAIGSAILLASMGVVAAGIVVSRSGDRFGSFGFVPAATRDGERTLVREHYDDQRDVRLAAAPFVPSQVVADSYLKVTVPIRPLLDAEALRRRCPDSPRSMVARLDCLAALHPLLLDGQELPARYELGSDPKAQRPALIAMIDVRALPPGRHELVVGQPEDPDGARTPPDRIPFWR